MEVGGRIEVVFLTPSDPFPDLTAAHRKGRRKVHSDSSPIYLCNWGSYATVPLCTPKFSLAVDLLGLGIVVVGVVVLSLMSFHQQDRRGRFFFKCLNVQHFPFLKTGY